MSYSGPNSLFIRVLLDKRYALPYKVIDGLVFHFARFSSDKRIMPVLWHQACLSFIQNYKQDITAEQKDLLISVIDVHRHHAITPEIRRELLNSSSREHVNDIVMLNC